MSFTFLPKDKNENFRCKSSKKETYTQELVVTVTGHENFAPKIFEFLGMKLVEAISAIVIPGIGGSDINFCKTSRKFLILFGPMKLRTKIIVVGDVDEGLQRLP